MDQLIARMFRLEMQLRLYHWNTKNYARHKASCEAIQQVVSSMDRIVETLLGSFARASVVPQSLDLKVHTLNDSDMPQYLLKFCEYLQSWNSLAGLNDTEILNLRDELLGHLKQVIYLMTLS